MILGEIEKAHNIKVSYINEELTVYTLIPPDKKLSLQEKLDYIEQHTKLKIEALGSGYYTVYNDAKMDKPLCGYLIDKDTGKGIENAEIIVSGVAASISSDASGYFSIPVLSANTIYIRHLAYKEITVNPQDLYVADCPKINMEPVVIELQEVVAQRYLATGIYKKESGELVVKPKNFGILPGLTDPDVLQTMQQVPGIISVDETVSNISVRGGTHDQNLFLWNGVRMFQTGHFFGLISAFNPLTATSISIYKNGTPAFYGESVSSLANISTYSNAADNNYVVAVDMINAAFLAGIKLSKKDRLEVSGRRTFSDLFVSPTFEDYQHRVFQNTTITDVAENQDVPVHSDEDFYFYDLTLQYQHKFNENHELVVNGIGMENNLTVHQQTPDANRDSELGQTNLGGSIQLRSQWNEKNRSEIQGYISWYNLDATNEAIENDQVTAQHNTVFDKGVRLKYDYIYSPQLELSGGYQLNEVSITNFDEVNEPPFSRDEREASVSHAVVAEGRYTSKNGLSRLNAGVRGNYFEKFGLFLAEPRLAFTQVLTEGLNLEIIGEQKSQTVAQIIDLQQDFLGVEKRRWVLANDHDIPVQKSSQASVGASYTHNKWLFTLEGFYKKVNGITSDSQGFQNQFEFTSATGSYRVLGAEVLLQKSFTRFYSWVSYSFNKNEYNFESFSPSEFPNNFEIIHAVSAAGIYEWNRLRIALGAKWRTGKPFTPATGFIIDPDNPVNSQIVYDTPNSANLDDFFQVNFSASKTWDLGKNVLFTASGSVLNIFDHDNIINRYYRINKSNNNVQSVNSYALGLTPNIGLKIVF